MIDWAPWWWIVIVVLAVALLPIWQFLTIRKLGKKRFGKFF